MTNSIDDVIEAFETRFKLRNIDADTRNRYRAFLERQLGVHPEYDLDFASHESSKHPHLYVNVLADKLLIFGYMLGEIKINTSPRKRGKERKKITSAKDLYLLKKCEVRDSKDARLFKAHSRIRSRAYNKRLIEQGLKCQTWGQMIDEIGKDPEVLKHFSRINVNYHLVKQTPSPEGRHPISGQSYV